MRDRVPTTIRFTDEDREIIERIQALSGIEGATAVIRMALREALAVWERKQAKR